MKKLKVGFLIDETDVSYYIADLIRHVEDSDLFESPTLITGYKKNSPRSFGEKLISILDPNPFKIADSILKIILNPDYLLRVTLKEMKEKLFKIYINYL